MKEKIIIFVVGLLAGAVISTGAFCAYTITSNNNKCTNQTMQAPGGQPPSMNNSQNDQSGNQNGGQPPEKPGENNSQTTQQNNN